MIFSMRRIIQNKKTWYWLSLITLIIVLDLVIFTPALKQDINNNTLQLNKNLDNNIPVYGGITSRSLFSLRSDYYYQLEIVDSADLMPIPKNVSNAKFMGYYIPAKTQVSIKLKIDDPVYYPDGKVQKEVAKFTLAPGTKTLMLKGEGSLSRNEIRITVDVKQIDLDVKVKEEGLLWNSYEPTPVYFVNLDVKRIRVVEVYEQK